MNTWELMELYYSLGDGIAWVPQDRLVTFKSKASADTFKAAAPNWRAQYMYRPGWDIAAQPTVTAPQAPRP